jgi:hypothetical protein
MGIEYIGKYVIEHNLTVFIGIHVPELFGVHGG